MCPRVSPAFTIYCALSCLGVGRIRAASGVGVSAISSAVKPASKVGMIGGAVILSGARVGVGSRVAVGGSGVSVAVIVGTGEGPAVFEGIGRNGS